MKRLLSIALILTICTALLAACDSSSTKGETTDESLNSSEKVTEVTGLLNPEKQTLIRVDYLSDDSRLIFYTQDHQLYAAKISKAEERLGNPVNIWNNIFAEYVMLQNGFYVYDPSGEFCNLYDYNLKLLSRIPLPTDGQPPCFCISNDLETMAYAQITIENDNEYLQVYSGKVGSSEKQKILSRKITNLPANQLAGIDSMRFLSDDRTIFYTGGFYPQNGENVESRPCFGTFGADGKNLKTILSGIEYRFSYFDGGYLKYDTNVPAGETSSGKIEIFQNNGTSKTITLKKSNESQSVYISQNGDYFCTVLEEATDTQITVDFTLYDAKTGAPIGQNSYHSALPKGSASDNIIQNVSVANHSKQVSAVVTSLEDDAQRLLEFDF